ncbi:hypothetical protein CHS0354_004221 [Potamilus streckersoni]|uniref:Cadherin domain-containing protein n=1 Tax=Potamilus streckersoni TaxID=2493646 RepID=A0AAE0VIP3_9BIVA|nr:hypothetical protein CHS0354_004221 [Potamilus streckersoni]
MIMARESGIVIYVTIVLVLYLIKTNAQDTTVKYTIFEEQEDAVVFIGNIANDTHLLQSIPPKDLQLFLFQILPQSNQHASLFSINETTSILSTVKKIDRESFEECQYSSMRCVISFNVIVYRYNSPSLPDIYRMILAEVIVEDINDNPPEFPISSITVQVPEEDDSFVFTINGARDKDTGIVNSYEVSGNGLFLLDVPKIHDDTRAQEPELNIKVAQTFDREKQNLYSVTIKARDGGSPERTGTLTMNIIITDINDNAPTFLQQEYNLSVPENLVLESGLLNVSATDADSGENGVVSYRFSSRTATTVSEYFEIDASLGEIKVIGEVDYEKIQEFHFYVVAYDKGNPVLTSQTKVSIYVTDVNDNSPQININLPPGGTTLSEDTAIGSYIALVEVLDSDSGENGRVTCISADPNFALELLTLKNNYKVVLFQRLDREVNPEHEVMLRCVDFGIPHRQSVASFRVKVTDVNDNFPIFTEEVFNISVEENNIIEARIGIVSAADKDENQNGLVAFSLHPETLALYSIDRDSGIIKARISFDREIQDKYIFRVIASDKGTPSLTSTGTVVVHITDQNDNDPHFIMNSTQLFVYENQPAATRVGVIQASDPDNGINGSVSLRFLYQGNISELFVFFPDSGLVKTRVPLDREVKSKYEFSVLAVDMGGRSSSAKISIFIQDLNDNDPVIEYPNDSDDSVLIPLTTKVGSVIAQILASDRDEGKNAQLHYSLNTTSNSDDIFIELDTGKLILNRSLNDADVDLDLIFQVIVTDEGYPPRNASKMCKLLVTKDEHVQAAAIGNLSQSIWIAIAVVCITVLLSVLMVTVIFKICLCDKRKAMKSRSDDRNVLDEKLSEISSTSSKDANGNDNKRLPEKYMYDRNLAMIQNNTSTSLQKEKQREKGIPYTKEQLKPLTSILKRRNSDTQNQDVDTLDSGRGGSEGDSSSFIGTVDQGPDCYTDFADKRKLQTQKSVDSGIGIIIHNPCKKSSQVDQEEGVFLKADSIKKSRKVSGVPKSTANFVHTPCRTATRKELQTLRNINEPVHTESDDNRSDVSYSQKKSVRFLDKSSLSSRDHVFSEPDHVTHKRSFDQPSLSQSWNGNSFHKDISKNPSFDKTDGKIGVPNSGDSSEGLQYRPHTVNSSNSFPTQTTNANAQTLFSLYKPNNVDGVVKSGNSGQQTYKPSYNRTVSVQNASIISGNDIFKNYGQHSRPSSVNRSVSPESRSAILELPALSQRIRHHSDGSFSAHELSYLAPLDSPTYENGQRDSLSMISGGRGDDGSSTTSGSYTLSLEESGHENEYPHKDIVV